MCYLLTIFILRIGADDLHIYFDRNQAQKDMMCCNLLLWSFAFQRQICVDSNYKTNDLYSIHIDTKGKATVYRRCPLNPINNEKK